MSGRDSTVSKRYQLTTNEKPSETMFQRVLLDFILKTFGLGAENEPRAHIRGHFSRIIFTPPNPLVGGTLGSLVSNIVFRSKQSLPYQREVWRDCLYGRGLFRETHKKRIALCYPSCVERKTRVCPSALYSIYQALTFAQYYTPNSRDTWVVSRCRFRVRLLPYKLQNYSCLRQIYE